MQYPDNLIHAQKMYALSMGELLRVEKNIAQLQFHLRERELKLGQAILSGQATITLVPVHVSASQGKDDAPQIHVEAEVRQAGVNQAPGDPAQPQPEHLRQHRQRLSNAVKIAFVMLILEFSYQWFFVYFFGVFLYIGGIFDPFIVWFQRRPTRESLERQLDGLRNPQRRAEERVTQRPEQERPEVARPENPPRATATTSDTTAEAPVTSVDNTNPTGSSSSEEGTATGGLQEDATEKEGANSESPPTGERAAPAPGDENVENADQPPYWSRFIYQLFVMFFLTLLPWWNPDPRYADTQGIM